MSESTPPKLTNAQRKLFIEWLQWHQQEWTDQSQYWRKKADQKIIADWCRSCAEVEMMLVNEHASKVLLEELRQVFGKENP